MSESIPPNDAAPRGARTVKSVKRETPRAERRRVLLVDDERHVVDAIAVQLRHRFDITTTCSPVEAIALVRDQGFAAVVSDLRMPEIDGVELLEQVKLASPATGRVLLTGQGDMWSAAAAINTAGVHVFLVKPCPSNEVANAITKAIASAHPIDADALVQLGQKATLGSMAGSIGYEMVDLLSALGSSISSLRDQALRGELPATEDVALLDMVNIRLRSQAKQLRDLAQPRPLAFADLDVTHVIVETIGILQRAGVLRLIAVHTELPDMPALARLDRGSIEGVFMSLLKNAAEAIEKKAVRSFESGRTTEPGRILVRVTTDNLRVRVDLEDNGCGIAPDRIPKLFELDQETRKQKRGGLGLGIVRAAIERQGGSITVSSALGTGARVTIVLPRVHGNGR